MSPLKITVIFIISIDSYDKAIHWFQVIPVCQQIKCEGTGHISRLSYYIFDTRRHDIDNIVYWPKLDKLLDILEIVMDSRSERIRPRACGIPTIGFARRWLTLTKSLK